MNPTNRRTALTLVERKAWGGSQVDSLTYYRMFKHYKPFNFGVKAAQLFTSKLGEHMVNKKFTYMTVASGNYYSLPGGVEDYEWHVVGSPRIDFTFTDLLVGANDQVGKGNATFEIALDRPWLHEPAIIKIENSNAPLIKIIGHPVQMSPNSWKYKAQLQTSNPNAWLDAKYISPGRTAIDASTSVASELNNKYAGDSYSEMYKLQSYIGRYARKIEITDRAIRAELSARKSGKSYKDDDRSIGKGFIFQQKLRNQNTGDVVEAGAFITMAEARLEERIMQDREIMAEFGSAEKTFDRDTQREIKVAPGWRQIVRDGHYWEHNGSITLSDIYEYLMNIFITRRQFSERKIRIASGEAGIEFLHRLLAEEAKLFTTIDTNFVRARTDGDGYNSNELEFGAQFTRWVAPNGLIVEMVYDPIKDDRHFFPELAPGTNRTVESFCYDIFDFGATDQKAVDAGVENITMVMEEDAEEYFTASNVYNFETGAIQDGSNAYGTSKELGIYRAINGSLAVWDVTRVGRIEFNPNF